MSLLGPDVTRRRFALASGSAAVALLAGCGSEEEPAPSRGPLGAGDLDVIDFALGLELLERDFYERVLESGSLGGDARRVVEGNLSDEREHVRALTRVLRDNGHRPSPAPQVDPARLAGGERQLLTLAAELEDLGANAYAGAAPEILDREVLATALSIHSVEARHAAALHRLLGTRFVPDGAFAAPRDRMAALAGLRGVVR